MGRVFIVVIISLFLFLISELWFQALRCVFTAYTFYKLCLLLYWLQLLSCRGRRKLNCLVLEKVPSLRMSVEDVVEVPNAHQRNNHHSSREATQEDVGDGLPNLSKELVEDMVAAVAVDLSVVEWPLNNILLAPLSIIQKAGKLSFKEGHLSRGVVAL